jgi:hypothetical protein
MAPVLRDAGRINDGYRFVILDDRLLLSTKDPDRPRSGSPATGCRSCIKCTRSMRGWDWWRCRVGQRFETGPCGSGRPCGFSLGEAALTAAGA